MGFSKKYQYSLYRPGPFKRFFLFRVIRFLLIALLFYEIMTVYIISTVIVQSSSMLPGIQKEDRLLIFKPLYSQYLFDKFIKIPGLSNPKRGDIVIYRQQFVKNYPWYLKPVNEVIRFFTLQKKNLKTNHSYNDSISVKRIIGLPGDTVKIKNNVVQIKPSGGERFLTEFELTGNRYNINISSLPENWNSDENPFNYDTEETAIKDGYYFIIGDNRELFPDSRSSGLVSSDLIKGKAVLRYWPFERINVF